MRTSSLISETCCIRHPLSFRESIAQNVVMSGDLSKNVCVRFAALSECARDRLEREVGNWLFIIYGSLNGVSGAQIFLKRVL